MKKQDLLEKYGYNKEDFLYKKVLVTANTMNHGFNTFGYRRVLVPKEIAQDLFEVTMNFQLDSIRFYDEAGQLLLTTLDEAYDDIAYPEAFVLSGRIDTSKKKIEKVNWERLEKIFTVEGYETTFREIRMGLLFEFEKTPDLYKEVEKGLEKLLKHYKQLGKEKITAEDIEFDIMYPY